MHYVEFWKLKATMATLHLGIVGAKLCMGTIASLSLDSTT